MKEERVAILSMVEKGIISVEEAERLFAAIDKKEEGRGKGKLSGFFSRSGDRLENFAQNVSKKTGEIVKESKPTIKKAGEKINEVVEDAKPAMKKAGEKIGEAVEDVKPAMKKAADKVVQKAEQLRRKSDKVDVDFDDDKEIFEEEVNDSDFVSEVVVAPLEKAEEVEIEDKSTEAAEASAEKVVEKTIEEE